jgi:hypothetical protein
MYFFTISGVSVQLTPLTQKKRKSNRKESQEIEIKKRLSDEHTGKLLLLFFV